jgi:hypothetical protein
VVRRRDPWGGFGGEEVCSKGLSNLLGDSIWLLIKHQRKNSKKVKSIPHTLGFVGRQVDKRIGEWGDTKDDYIGLGIISISDTFI